MKFMNANRRKYTQFYECQYKNIHTIDKTDLAEPSEQLRRDHRRTVRSLLAVMNEFSLSSTYIARMAALWPVVAVIKWQMSDAMINADNRESDINIRVIATKRLHLQDEMNSVNLRHSFYKQTNLSNTAKT